MAGQADNQQIDDPRGGNRWAGSMVALVTPFRAGAVDFAALDKLVELQIEAGTDALVPCGTTGESPTLTHAEHDQVIEAVVRRAAGRCLVVAGTGSNSTAEAVRLTRHAHEVGADAVLLVSPYYNKPTQTGLFEHFATLAREVDIPQIVYNIPGRCGVEISVDTLVRLREAHDNIVGVKHATGSTDGASALLARSDLAVISGDDSMTLPLMAVGGCGVISVLANLLPRETKALVDAALSGDYAAARRRHLSLFGLASGLLSLETNPMPIKTALAMKGLIAEEFRLPMCPMQPENKERLGRILTEAGVL
jgi:4-hydroxy-tetrahydrodipicolinate synthase